MSNDVINLEFVRKQLPAAAAYVNETFPDGIQTADSWGRATYGLIKLDLPRLLALAEEARGLSDRVGELELARKTLEIALKHSSDLCTELQRQRDEVLAMCREAAAAKPFGCLGDGLGERLMANASPDDYWPVPPVQEPTGAPTPADPHTALGGSGVDAHGDAEDDHDDYDFAGEQPGCAGLVTAVVVVIILAAVAGIFVWAGMGGQG